MSLAIHISKDEHIKNLEAMLSGANRDLIKKVFAIVPHDLGDTEYDNLQKLSQQFSIIEISKTRENPHGPAEATFRVHTLLDFPTAGAQYVLIESNNYDMSSEDMKNVLEDHVRNKKLPDERKGYAKNLPKSTFSGYLTAICPLVGKLSIAAAFLGAGLLAKNLYHDVEVKDLKLNFKEFKLSVGSIVFNGK